MGNHNLNDKARVNCEYPRQASFNNVNFFSNPEVETVMNGSHLQYVAWASNSSLIIVKNNDLYYQVIMTYIHYKTGLNRIIYTNKLVYIIR